jgi:hypothetical protein
VSNQLSASHIWAAVGAYPVVLTAFNDSNPGGVSATVTVHVVEQVVHYVAAGSTNATWPYTNWATAAVNIQDALDAPSSGDQVLVTNGAYQSGGLLVTGTTTLSRAAVTKALNVQSVNGPATTSIDGAGAARCVYLSAGAALTGFTLTNGATSGNGGGILCVSTANTVTNCVLVGNSAGAGGGAYQGTLNNCVLARNASSWGGGASSSTLNGCTLTNNNNAATYSTLNNCVVAGNARWGTTYYCQLTNCVLTGNPEGASFRGTLVNCLLTANGGDASEGDLLINCTVVGNTNGLYDSLAYNSIVYYNDATGGANYVNDGELNPNGLNYCCTTPLPPADLGGGNIANTPLVVDLASGDLRLRSTSPCINSGNNLCVGFTSDLDGNPRTKGGTVDIGAYEFQNPSSVVSYAWLQQYGLPTDGTADFGDGDNDHMTAWHEWMAGTDPTNPLSVLKMLALSNSFLGVTVSWQSVSGKTYYLQGGPDLLQPSLSSIQSNLLGQAGITTFTDTNAHREGLYFYRVGVQ